MSHFHNNMLLGSAGNQGAYEIERSLRFQDDDSAYLNRTPSSAGDRKTWTWSAWVKRGETGSYLTLFGAGVASPAYDALRFDTSDRLHFYQQGATTTTLTTDAVYRDVSAWYHVVLKLNSTASEAALFVNGVEQSWTGTQPTNTDGNINNNISHAVGASAVNSGFSAHFDGYLAEVHFIDGQALNASEFGEYDDITGAWVPKEYTGSYGTNGYYLKFEETVNLTTTATLTAPFGGTAENARVTDGNFVISNTTTGSSFTLVQEDLGSSQTVSRYEIHDLSFSGGTSTWKLQYSTDGSSWTDGATLAVTATAQDFYGSLNVTARYVRLRATAFGTNGIGKVDSFIVYQDSFGADSSGRGNTWSLNNFGFFDGVGQDSMSDTPSNNYPTINRFDKAGGDTFEGNLTFAGPYSSGGVTQNGHGSRSTMKFPASGKWYVEAANITFTGAGNSCMLGFTSSEQAISATAFSGTLTPWLGVDASVFNGTIRLSTNGAGSSTGTGTILFPNPTALVSGDIVNFAIDFDNGKLWVGKNGTWYNSGDPAAGTNATTTFTVGSKPWAFWAEYVSSSNNVNRSQPRVNFGQQGFEYDVPDGFLELNSENLPEPTIKDGTEYFTPVLYTGNLTARNITVADSKNNSWQPDWVWIKGRPTTSSHTLYDSVRGATKVLFSHNNNSESTDADTLTQFRSDGFSLGVDVKVNTNGDTYASWNWKAGGNSNTFNVDGTGYATAAAAGLDGGTLTPTGASVNTTSGFSIIAYTGDGNNPGTSTVTVSHGLSASPAMIITKKRSSGGTDYNWSTWHQDIGANYGIWLNLNNGRNASMWRGYTNNSSTVFSPPDSDYGNVLNETYINYVFAEVAGFSKFGSYVGTGNTDGPFINCGFSVAYLMVKKYTDTENWSIYDDKRNTYNPRDKEIWADSGLGEYDGNRYIDFLSNGFKPKANSGTGNLLGESYIFMAFAKNPFKYANAV